MFLAFLVKIDTAFDKTVLFSIEPKFVYQIDGKKKRKIDKKSQFNDIKVESVLIPNDKK